MIDVTEQMNALIEKQNRRLAERRRDDFKKVLSTPEGRRVLWWLLEEARVFHSTFNQNALVMAQAEGKRDIGLALLERINPETLNKMRNEAVSDAKSEELLRQRELADLKKKENDHE